LFPAGTKMLFMQNAAPSGWAFVSSNNDRVILNSSTVGEGGSTGGSWTLDGLTVANHTHGSGSLAGGAHTHTGPSHTHSGPDHSHGPGTYNISIPRSQGADNGSNWAISTNAEGNNIPVTGTSDDSGTGETGAAGTGATGSSTVSISGSTSSGGAGSVSSAGTWRPAYVKSITCEKT